MYPLSICEMSKSQIHIIVFFVIPVYSAHTILCSEANKCSFQANITRASIAARNLETLNRQTVDSWAVAVNSAENKDKWSHEQLLLLHPGHQEQIYQ